VVCVSRRTRTGKNTEELPSKPEEIERKLAPRPPYDLTQHGSGTHNHIKSPPAKPEEIELSLAPRPPSLISLNTEVALAITSNPRQHARTVTLGYSLILGLQNLIPPALDRGTTQFRR